jgi:transcriptional regulator with XRE-family HTH domain
MKYFLTGLDLSLGSKELKEQKILGETIRNLRIKSQFSQEELAYKSGENSVSYLAKIENGRVNTTSIFLVKIAQCQAPLSLDNNSTRMQ